MIKNQLLVALMAFQASLCFGQGSEESAGRQYGIGLPRDLAVLGVPDADYPQWPLREDQASYADISGERMKEWVNKIAAIALQSKADGNKYWGRLPGTIYDMMTMDLMDAEFRRLGLVTERMPFVIPSDWTPTQWQAVIRLPGMRRWTAAQSCRNIRR